MLDKRDDGSVAFFLDGDLQFDSRDEHIYHEGLALPALALAESRTVGDLKALIIGGGDGLTARELLKSERIVKVDLVDYDNEILALAAGEFAQFNQNSMQDSRLTVCVEDARLFVKRALASGTTYDLIISDLTAAHDADAAQLHAIEFYDELKTLLGEHGLLAVNSASPSGTAEAYFSIFNSILSASLNPRAYRIFLPSFAEQGYGEDWGFILASPSAIDASELLSVKDGQRMSEMFFLPKEVFDKQNTSCAGSAGSDILVQYLFNSTPIDCDSKVMIDTVSLDLSALTAPKQTGLYLLPHKLNETLAHWKEDTSQQEAVMNEVFELMPALRRFQTREMIADFLDKPVAFLGPVNLKRLVDELLKRSTELPGKVVEELVFLKDKIVEFAEDQERIFALGLRSLAIIALVVIMGNLMYPDSVYAKGHGGVVGHGTRWGGNGYGNGYGYGTNTVTNVGGHWGPWHLNDNGKRVRNWIKN